MNRNDMYNTFHDYEFRYHYPISFEKRNKKYLRTRIPKYIEWCYGDTILLELNIRDLDGDEETTFEGTVVIVEFFNFRGEVVHKETITDGDIDIEEMSVYVPIERELSIDVFKRGTYTCSVTLLDDDTEYETILPREFCEVHVR